LSVVKILTVILPDHTAGVKWHVAVLIKI